MARDIPTTIGTQNGRIDKPKTGWRWQLTPPEEEIETAKKAAKLEQKVLFNLVRIVEDAVLDDEMDVVELVEDRNFIHVLNKLVKVIKRRDELTRT